MKRSSLPTTHIDFRDVLSEIKRKDKIKLSTFSQLTPDIIDYRASLLQLHDNESISTYIEEDTYRVHTISVDQFRYINFIFTRSGSNNILLKNNTLNKDNVDVIILINTNNYKIKQEVHEKKRALSFMVYPEVLIDCYGLRVDALPNHLKSAILGIDTSPQIIKIRLIPRAKISLQNVYDTNFNGKTLDRYVFSKVEELVCETVFALNFLYRKSEQFLTSMSDEQFRRSIEEAAYIYRQSIGRKISVKQICSEVGLNKNKLNNGFLEIYGKYPGEYGREQNLEWCRQQISNSDYSLKQISSAAGYSTVNAFSRAYSNLFGTAPSKT